jgi:hypothetical protein
MLRPSQFAGAALALSISVAFPGAAAAAQPALPVKVEFTHTPAP